MEALDEVLTTMAALEATDPDSDNSGRWRTLSIQLHKLSQHWGLRGSPVRAQVEELAVEAKRASQHQGNDEVWRFIVYEMRAHGAIARAGARINAVRGAVAGVLAGVLAGVTGAYVGLGRRRTR